MSFNTVMHPCSHDLAKKQYFQHPAKFLWALSLQTTVRAEAETRATTPSVSTDLPCLGYGFLQTAPLSVADFAFELTHTEKHI